MAFLTLNKSYIVAGETFRLTITDRDLVSGNSVSYNLSGEGLTTEHFVDESSLSGSITIGNNYSGFKDFTTGSNLPTGDDFMVLKVSSPNMSDMYLNIYSDNHYLAPETKIELGDTFDTWRKKTNGFIARLDVLEDSTSDIRFQTITCDGINSEYTLNFPVTSDYTYLYDIHIDGISQNPADAYTINEDNNTIIFSDIPAEFSSVSIISRFDISTVSQPLVTTWGSISGDISDNADLIDALDAKVSDTDLSDIVIDVSNSTGSDTTTEATINVTGVNGSDAHFHLGSVDNEISVTKSTVDDYSVVLQHTTHNLTETFGGDSPLDVTALDFGDQVTLVTGVETNTTGHLTSYETTAFTLPSIDTISDLVVTDVDVISDVDVGGISKTDIVPSGTSLQGFITQMLSQTYYPTFVLPSVNLTDNIAATVEVGTLGLTLTANYNAGAINGDISGGIWDPNLKQADRAGVATQYTFSGATIPSSPVTQTGNSLALPTTTIEEGANTFNVVTDHDSGPQPLDSLGTAFDSPLPSGDVSDGLTVNGKRNAFYGVDLTSTDSAGVRALTSKLNPSNGTSFTINIPAGATDVVFAYPATLRDVDSVIYVEGLNAETKTAFSQQTVNVEGANSYTAIGYKLYTFTPANPFGATATYIVTI
jgi:hypothetical protein